MKPQHLLLSSILTVAALSAATQAQALTTSGSFSNPLQTTDITQSGDLPLFDTSLGTLTGAVLTINGAINSSMTMRNGSPTATIQVKSTLETDLGFASTVAGVNALFDGTTDISIIYGTGQQTLAPGASYSTSLSPAASFSAKSFDLGSQLASLGAAGGGNFGLSCQSLSGVGASGGGGMMSLSSTNQAMCGASITYTYDAVTTAVPEAGTPVMLAAGLLVLGALARRHRRPSKT